MVKELELSRKFVIGEVLARTARQNPTDVAVTFGKILYTYGKLNERVNCLANGLIGLGIKKNDKVALLLSNSTEIIESYFAIAKIGAVCVPLNFRLVENEIEHLLEHSDSKIIIYHDTFEDIINSIKKKSRKIEHYIIVGKSANLGVINYEKIIEYNPAEEPIIIVDEDDVTNIMYTAGTTGLPKGAMLTHKNQLMGAINFLLMFGIKSDDKWL